MPFMSLDELERQYGVAPQQQPQQPPPRRDVAALPGEVQTNNSGISEFGKGFRAGWQGWKGNYTRNAAMAAELAGNQQAADGLNKAADGAVTTAPRVQSMFDIQSMSDAGDYVAGTAGQAMSSIAQMGTMSAIGGLLGRGVAGKGGFRIGATLGGLGDAILQQAGANLAKQQASEEARKADKWDRAGAAYGTGVVQGSLDYVTDRMLLGKVFNPAKDAIRGSGFNQAAKYFSGEVAKDMGREAATEGAQELMGQAQTKALGDTTSYNWRDVADNAFAGAVGGGIMGAPGSVRNTLAAKTPDGSMVERVAGKVNEYTDALKRGFTDLGTEAGKAAADPAGTAEAATQATKDKFTEWADMAQGTAAGKFTKDVLDSFTGAYRKKAEEVAKAAQEQAKANPEQAKSTYQQAGETLRNLWHDSKRTVTDLYDSLRNEKQAPVAPEVQAPGTPPAVTQEEPTLATQPAEMEQETPSPDAAQGPTTGFRFNEDNDAGLTAFLARPDSMRQSLAETYQTRLAGTDPLIASLDPSDRRDQAALAEFNRRDKAGEPLDFDSVMQAVDEQVGSKPGEKQYSLLRDSYDNFQFMNNRLQGDALKQIPAERRQEVLSGVESMLRSGKLLQSEEGVQLLEGLFGPNADEVLQYVRRERTDTADNGVVNDEDSVSIAGVQGTDEERADAAAIKEARGITPDQRYASHVFEGDGPKGVRYRKGASGLPMRRDSADFKQHELALKNEAGSNPAQSSRPINALQYLREGITPNNRTKARAAMLQRLQEQEVSDRMQEHGLTYEEAAKAVGENVAKYGEDAYLAKHYVFRTDDRSPEERGLSDRDWESLRATGKTKDSRNITVMRNGKPTVVNPVAVSMLGQRSLEGQYDGIDDATVARFFAEGMSQLVNDPAVEGFSDAKSNAVQLGDQMDIDDNTVVYVRNGKNVTYGQLAPHINKPAPEQAKANALRDREKAPLYERGQYSHLFDNTLLSSDEEVGALYDEVTDTIADKRESLQKLDWLMHYTVRDGMRARRAGRMEERDALAAKYRELQESRAKAVKFIEALEKRADDLASGSLDVVARSNLEREQGGAVLDQRPYGEDKRYKDDNFSRIVGEEQGYKADPGARNEKFVGRPATGESAPQRAADRPTATHEPAAAAKPAKANPGAVQKAEAERGAAKQQAEELVAAMKDKTPEEAQAMLDGASELVRGEAVRQLVDAMPEPSSTDTPAPKDTVAKDLVAAMKGDTAPREFAKGLSQSELLRAKELLGAMSQKGLRRNAFLKVVTDALNGPNDDGSGGGKAKAAPAKKTDAGDKQFSKQAPSGQGAREKFVREYLRRVFGDEPKAVFSDTFGFAGSYDRDGDFFEFSLHAPLGTEAHEALHRWFKKLQDSNDPGAQEMIKTIVKAATSEHNMSRLRELLKDHPEAVKQLSDPEEAAAYAFQFYSYGLLKLESAPAKGFFAKIAAAVKRFLKLASDEQRTQQFFDYFSQGKWAADKRPSAVAQVVRDSYSASSKVRWANQQLAPLGEAASKLFFSAADRLENTEVPALKQLSRLFKAEVGDDGGMGFLQRAVNTRNRWVNTYAKAVKGLSDKQKANVLAFVRGEEVAGGMTAEESAAVKTVRSLFDEVYDHAQKRGVPLKRRANYFPRVWDAEKIRAKQDDFVNMLVGKYGFTTDDAHRVRATLQTGANDHVVNESPEDPGYNPFFSAVNERKLPDMDAEDIKPFLETSLDGIMARYMQQASKRIEYEAKFGAKGERIHAMLEQAKRQGASEEDLATAKSSVMAMEGTLPVTLSSRWQTFNDVMITYQNVRLLPLSILIQATDAIGIAARSGSMNNAWQAFKQGIKDVPKWLKKDPKLSEWDQVAVAMGVLEDTALEDVSQTYFNTQTSGMARTINDKFFKWTLMDGWNKSMRVMATKTATEFIAEHAAGKDEHSTRMLKELGLTQAQAKAMLDKDGKLVLDPSNEQQREAIFRFVDQAVIRANPADRTVWGSDPRFAVIQHLKQYVYSFHRNILAHATHEASEGNWAPVQMLAAYVPVMAAGMYVRALAGNGGELPEYMEQWGFWDWVWNAFDRSGIAGLYNYHLWDLPGPTVTQAADAVKASQRGTLGAELADAVPGHQFASMM